MEHSDQVAVEVIRSGAWLTDSQLESCLAERTQAAPDAGLIDFCRGRGYLTEAQAALAHRAVADRKGIDAEMGNVQSIASALRMVKSIKGESGKQGDSRHAARETQGESTHAAESATLDNDLIEFESEITHQILDALTEEGYLTPGQQKEVVQVLQSGHSLKVALVSSNLMTEEDLTVFLCRRLQIPYVNLRAYQVDVELFSAIPLEQCLENWILPLTRNGGSVTIAVVEPPDEVLLNEIFSPLGMKPVALICTFSDFVTVAEQLLSAEISETRPAEKPKKGPESPSDFGQFLAIRTEFTRKSPIETLRRMRSLRKNKDLDTPLRALEAGGSVTSVARAIEELEEGQELAVEFLATLTGRPFLDLLRFDLSDDLARSVPAEFARAHTVVPLAQIGDQLTVAVENPINITTFDALERMTGLRPHPVIVPGEQARSAVRNLYPEKEEKHEQSKVKIRETERKEELSSVFRKLGLTTAAGKPGRLARELSEQDIIHISDILLADAIRSQVSDIHVELYEEVFQIRHRKDGGLQTIVQAPKNVHAPIISRLKIMCNMDIAEHRIPQDGRLKVTLDDADIDFRVSSLPTIFGEKIVMRILDKRALRLDLNDLGFNERAKQHFLNAISQPNGIVLVTGPTGSGKSTTLYSALGTLNSQDVNLITVEDPVEYNIHGINQVQVNAKVGLTFASALRSILRQDPDIVMVGEIRDGETAAIAIQAALTGHLVLSTLHTNDAPSSISRLFDMGVEPFLLSASLNLCQAQRLIRKVCPNCKAQQKIPSKTFQKLRAAVPQTVSDSQIVAYVGEGCDICDHTGCKGRTTLVEVLPMGPELKELIAEGAPVAKITAKAKELGFQTLFEDGVDKILRGVTSIEEVFAAAAA